MNQRRGGGAKTVAEPGGGGAGAGSHDGEQRPSQVPPGMDPGGRFCAGHRYGYTGRTKTKGT